MFGNVYKGKKVLVTGHTGFKGSWLCQWLVNCGAQVYGYSLAHEPQATLFEQLQLRSQIAEDHRGDIRDLPQLTNVFTTTQPDFVFHLAAQPLVRASYTTPVETFSTNVQGTVHVLECLRNLSHNCSAVIVTTDKCYENREWIHGYRECDPLGGADPYSASKAAAEIATASYRQSFFADSSVRVASARAGNVIGGGDWATDRIIPDCIRAFTERQAVHLRNPSSTRPWQHVLEPLSGYLWLAARMHSDTKNDSPRPDATEDLQSAFNFGPGLDNNRPVSDLVNAVSSHFDGARWVDDSQDINMHEASRLDLTIAKARHVLNWQPVWSFDKTIEETVQWYCSVADGQDAKKLTTSQIACYENDARAGGLKWASQSPEQHMHYDESLPNHVAA